MTPKNQIAVQLVGPDQLKLNLEKPVSAPGEYQFLAEIECVGLCFSDMKLLHQFDQHPRKGPVVAHLKPEVLATIPSYVPDGKPTVPGHETVVRVVTVGPKVTAVKQGQRYLVQADWRDLKTKGSNGAFGYNFEGALQQFVILDQRTIVAADGTSYLVPASSARSASATALVEPWACIEDAFIHAERTTLTLGGTLLLVATEGATIDLTGLDLSKAKQLLYVGSAAVPAGFKAVDLSTLAPQSVDDILFAGSDAALVERITGLLNKNGLMVIAKGHGEFGRAVKLPVGRVHYGNLRFVGYPGTSFAKAIARIPETGEVRVDDIVHVIGAAGPMGSMAVIRILSAEIPGLKVEASDMAADRLAVLGEKAKPLAERLKRPLKLYNPKECGPDAPPDYAMVMVPVGALVANAVKDCNPGGLINIFAGIPADVEHAIDLDLYCNKGLYFIGTSGSTMEDMQAVLAKVEKGTLDTNLSVGAVSGMAGAIEGLTAVKDGKIAGKILVYPKLANLPLMTLADLTIKRPDVAAKLDNGNWTKAAEDQLLKG